MRHCAPDSLDGTWAGLRSQGRLRDKSSSEQDYPKRPLYQKEMMKKSCYVFGRFEVVRGNLESKRLRRLFESVEKQNLSKSYLYKPINEQS